MEKNNLNVNPCVQNLIPLPLKIKMFDNHGWNKKN